MYSSQTLKAMVPVLVFSLCYTAYFYVRFFFSDRNSQLRMPLVPTPARLKLLQACDQCHFSGVHFSYRFTL
jgi:hypothetical protein